MFEKLKSRLPRWLLHLDIWIALSLMALILALIAVRVKMRLARYPHFKLFSREGFIAVIVSVACVALLAAIRVAIRRSRKERDEIVVRMPRKGPEE